MVIVTTAYWDTLTHGVERVPVPVSSWDGHSYYGVLGYSDTRGAWSMCLSRYRPGMVIVTTAYWDTLIHRVECVPVPVSSRDGHSYILRRTGIL